jgi:hypothetical protein
MKSLAFSVEFTGLTDKIKKELNITVMPIVDRSPKGEEAVIKFHLNRGNIDLLPTARELVEDFLVNKNVSLVTGLSDILVTSFFLRLWSIPDPSGLAPILLPIHSVTSFRQLLMALLI